MNQLSEKYDKNNWDTWKDLLSKYQGSEVTNKCDYCTFSMPNNSNLVCAATYYNKKIKEITNKEREGCDFEINFSTYMDIGLSEIDINFTNYINSPF